MATSTNAVMFDILLYPEPTTEVNESGVGMVSGQLSPYPEHNKWLYERIGGTGTVEDPYTYQRFSESSTATQWYETFPHVMLKKSEIAGISQTLSHEYSRIIALGACCIILKNGEKIDVACDFITANLMVFGINPYIDTFPRRDGEGYGGGFY